jgi:hypothetical protein
MSRLCKHCRRRHPSTGRGQFCSVCYEELIDGASIYLLPPDHPFMVDRNQRVERMRRRATRGVPLFERVEPDLS